MPAPAAPASTCNACPIGRTRRSTSASRSDGKPLAFFDVDMTTPVVLPADGGGAGPAYRHDRSPIRTGVWVADKSCAGTLQPDRDDRRRVRRDLHRRRRLGLQLHQRRALPEGLRRLPCRHAERRQHPGHLLAVATNGCTSHRAGRRQVLRAGQRLGRPTPASTSRAPCRLLLDTSTPTAPWSAGRRIRPTARSRRCGWPTRGPPTTVTADRPWDDQCPALAAGGRCTVGTARRVHRRPGDQGHRRRAVTRDCWQYQSTLTCTGAAPARRVRAAGGRRLHPAASTCTQTNPVTGVCEVTRTATAARCRPRPSRTAIELPDQRVLPGRKLLQHQLHQRRRLRAQSMSMLEAGREAGVYLDTDRMQVFKGEANRCRDRLLKNCCYADACRRRHDEPEPVRQRLAPGLRRADELREPASSSTRACRPC